MNDEAWLEANQRALMAELALLCERLERAAAAGPCEAPASEERTRDLEEARKALRTPSALDELCRAFSLSAFERALLLLCAGVELEGRVGALCAAAHGDTQRQWATLGLALAVLPGAHWSAFTPEAPLRRFLLVEVEARGSLTASPVRVAERVLHHLVGLEGLEERLLGRVEPLVPPEWLLASHHERAQRVARAWSQPGAPRLLLIGAELASLREVGAAACGLKELQPLALHASAIPAAAEEQELLCRLLERESLLSGRACLLECEEEGPVAARALALAERLRAPLLILAREPLRPLRQPLLQVEVPPPGAGEQRALWRGLLGPHAGALEAELDTAVAQFSLAPSAVRSAAAEVVARTAEARPEQLGAVLWEACRAQARPRLEGLAQRLEPSARWEDLVLPLEQLEILRGLPAQVRQRTRVHEEWGFGARGARGLGLAVLFHGPSGTGKTLAAEVLASELKLDLYRIDLSQVVDKYIGETEKNLRRLFDAADAGGAVLLFDEADALFGQRSEVKDSHDRHANIEVGYLLQRLESYRGLAILTTNMRDALDVAFLRRLRFLVEFPFPDVAQRRELWRRAFPAGTPTERLDWERLARLGVAGGHIRNMALTAAFLAADAGEPVRMSHLRRAARAEYAKLRKPCTELEGSEWSQEERP